jgi:ribonuclease P protein component
LIPERSIAAGAGGMSELRSQTSSNFAFPKRYRLTKTDEYSSVFGFRRAIKSLHFLLHYRPRSNESGEVIEVLPPRLGVVVPKKLVKAAVRRNLIKRLAREKFRLLRSQLPSFDLILRLAAKPGIPDRSALAAEISELLQKLNHQKR